MILSPIFAYDENESTYVLVVARYQFSDSCVTVPCIFCNTFFKKARCTQRAFEFYAYSINQ